MTAADYLYHRNMLKEYIGIRDNQDLSNELNRAGVTQEQWNELIKNGTGDKALVDKLFATKLGGHAARLLIDLDIECKEVNDVQKAVIHRGLATINMDPNDAHSGGKIGYYKVQTPLLLPIIPIPVPVFTAIRALIATAN